MNEEKTERTRTRRRYAKAGERSQKMCSFRLDQENEFWLSTQPNKGRYINNLIRADRLRRSDD